MQPAGRQHLKRHNLARVGIEPHTLCQCSALIMTQPVQLHNQTPDM